MFLFFKPTVVAKTNVTVLQSFLPSFNVDQWTTDAARFFATLQHWIGGKEDNKNIKVDFLVWH